LQHGASGDGGFDPTIERLVGRPISTRIGVSGDARRPRELRPRGFAAGQTARLGRPNCAFPNDELFALRHGVGNRAMR
jgi:hypothetical protein